MRFIYAAIAAYFCTYFLYNICIPGGMMISDEACLIATSIVAAGALAGGA